MSKLDELKNNAKELGLLLQHPTRDKGFYEKFQALTKVFDELMTQYVDLLVDTNVVVESMWLNAEQTGDTTTSELESARDANITLEVDMLKISTQLKNMVQDFSNIREEIQKQSIKSENFAQDPYYSLLLTRIGSYIDFLNGMEVKTVEEISNKVGLRLSLAVNAIQLKKLEENKVDENISKETETTLEEQHPQTEKTNEDQEIKAEMEAMEKARQMRARKKYEEKFIAGEEITDEDRDAMGDYLPTFEEMQELLEKRKQMEESTK